MKQNKKTILIVGAAAAVALLWYLKKKKSQESNSEAVGLEPPITAPVSQPAYVPEGFSAGGGGGGGAYFGGGGSPSTPVQGVTTTPELEHNLVCKQGEDFIGISAVKGKPGGIKCVPRHGNDPAERTT